MCRSCTNGHIITGFRASEEEVFCRAFDIEREIHFPVRSCTFYADKRLATKTEMEEIAWHLRSTSGKPTRNLGFVSANPDGQKREAEAEIVTTIPPETE